MIRLLPFLFCFVLSFPALASSEQDIKPAKTPKADLSELKHTHSGRIDKIIDGLTVLLKDGTIVRLASLDIPDFHIWENAPYSDAALKLLQETLPERTEVMLYQTRNPKKGRINRMNHRLAHLVIKEDETWVQGLLLAHGLARVYTAPDSNEILEQMYTAEALARDGKQGLWEDESQFLILSPDQTSSYIGEFVVVEGIVEKAASVRNNIYLNFGKDWKKDFTIMISPALRKKLSHNGISPLALAQKPVRVRGLLREYNGPLIELKDSAHLEILQKLSETPNLSPESDKQDNKADGS